MHGACREGDNCVFSHDPKSKPSMVCRYYRRGCCSYGSKCRSVEYRDHCVVCTDCICIRDTESRAVVTKNPCSVLVIVQSHVILSVCNVGEL